MAKDDTLGCHSIFDLRELAKKRVPRGPFEFVDRGTEEVRSLNNNREAIDTRTVTTVVEAVTSI